MHTHVNAVTSSADTACTRFRPPPTSASASTAGRQRARTHARVSLIRDAVTHSTPSTHNDHVARPNRQASTATTRPHLPAPAKTTITSHRLQRQRPPAAAAVCARPLTQSPAAARRTAHTCRRCRRGSSPPPDSCPSPQRHR